jgi:hypothetical protein
MYKILVILPFELRLDSETPVRKFTEGEHTLSEEEYGHWFVQGCIEEGRAKLLADMEEKAGSGDADDTVQVTSEEQQVLTEIQPETECEGADATESDGILSRVTRTELLALTAAQLRTLCEDADITIPSGSPTKAVLADLLLAGAKGVILAEGPDGIYVQKAEAE